MPVPVPSATVVLMRDGPEGLEVLLLERSRNAGFVPGAYVFPGGRVDAADASHEALALVDDLTVASAAERLDLAGGSPPAAAYYVAALREAFEETGILLGVRSGGTRVPTAAEDPVVARVRDDLLEDRIGFAAALEALACRASAREVEYFAHWITPEGLPRRYDTRFFIARAPAGADALVDPREITAALWIRPARAVTGAEDGALPMILPTVRTLEELAAFADTREALGALAGRKVATRRPTLPEGASEPRSAARRTRAGQ